MEKLIQIEQALQIGAKLFQIRAVPVVTNRSNSHYKSWQFQLLQIGAERPSKIQSQQKHNSLHF